MFTGGLASLEAGLPPMGEVGLLSVADKDFFHGTDATDVMSVDPDARQAHSSRIAHRQNQDSSVRPETSTLGTNTIREDALARLCPTSKRPPRRQISDSDHHMDHRNRLRAKISAEFNSCLLGPQSLKHFCHLDVVRGKSNP